MRKISSITFTPTETLPNPNGGPEIGISSPEFIRYFYEKLAEEFRFAISHDPLSESHRKIAVEELDRIENILATYIANLKDIPSKDLFANQPVKHEMNLLIDVESEPTFSSDPYPVFPKRQYDKPGWDWGTFTPPHHTVWSATFCEVDNSLRVRELWLKTMQQIGSSQ